MSKNQEIQRLDAILKNLPVDSYLSETLRHIRVQFESDIRSDFPTLPDLRQITNDKLAEQAALDAVRKEIAVAQQKLATLQAKAEQAKNDLVRHANALVNLNDCVAREARWYSELVKKAVEGTL